MNDYELRREINLLEGNINRMYVTDDKEELDIMHEWAKKRLENIYYYRSEEINKTNKNK